MRVGRSLCDNNCHYIHRKRLLCIRRRGHQCLRASTTTQWPPSTSSPISRARGWSDISSISNFPCAPISRKGSMSTRRPSSRSCTSSSRTYTTTTSRRRRTPKTMPKAWRSSAWSRTKPARKGRASFSSSCSSCRESTTRKCWPSTTSSGGRSRATRKSYRD